MSAKKKQCGHIAIKPSDRIPSELIPFLFIPSPEFDGGNVQTRASNTNMVRHSFFQLMVLVASLFLQVHCSPLTLQKRGACATEDPDESFLHEIGRLKSNKAGFANSQARKTPIEIETWFHVVSSKSESEQVSDDMIDAQVSQHPFIAISTLLT